MVEIINEQLSQGTSNAGGKDLCQYLRELPSAEVRDNSSLQAHKNLCSGSQPGDRHAHESRYTTGLNTHRVALILIQVSTDEV